MSRSTDADALDGSVRRVESRGQDGVFYVDFRVDYRADRVGTRPDSVEPLLRRVKRIAADSRRHEQDSWRTVDFVLRDGATMDQAQAMALSSIAFRERSGRWGVDSFCVRSKGLFEEIEDPIERTRRVADRVAEAGVPADRTRVNIRRGGMLHVQLGRDVEKGPRNKFHHLPPGRFLNLLAAMGRLVNDADT